MGNAQEGSTGEAVKLLETNIEMLRAGIFARLRKKYTTRFGEESHFLSAAVLNEAVVEEPANSQARVFRAKNQALIVNEAMNKHLDADLALGLSYLYAARPYIWYG